MIPQQSHQTIVANLCAAVAIIDTLPDARIVLDHWAYNAPDWSNPPCAQHTDLTSYCGAGLFVTLPAYRDQLLAKIGPEAASWDHRCLALALAECTAMFGDHCHDRVFARRAYGDWDGEIANEQTAESPPLTDKGLLFARLRRQLAHYQVCDRIDTADSIAPSAGGAVHGLGPSVV